MCVSTRESKQSESSSWKICGWFQVIGKQICGQVVSCRKFGEILPRTIDSCLEKNSNGGTNKRMCQMVDIDRIYLPTMATTMTRQTRQWRCFVFCCWIVVLPVVVVLKNGAECSTPPGSSREFPCSFGGYNSKHVCSCPE